MQVRACNAFVCGDRLLRSLFYLFNLLAMTINVQNNTAQHLLMKKHVRVMTEMAVLYT